MIVFRLSIAWKFLAINSLHILRSHPTRHRSQFSFGEGKVAKALTPDALSAVICKRRQDDPLGRFTYGATHELAS